MPWLHRMQRTRGKHAAMFLSACVGLHVCNTIVSLHMKIWEKFCLKLESRHFKRISSVYASCPWMPEVLHHGNMIFTFILCIFWNTKKKHVSGPEFHSSTESFETFSVAA